MEDAELMRLEADAIENYINEIYSLKVPEPTPPTKKELSFWSIAGIEATLFTISGLGITIYSSVRTGGLFYIMELLLLREYELPEVMANGLGLLSMLMSLLAFELFVLAQGFVKGKNNKTLISSEIGLWSSLIVIVLSGIFTGFGLVPNLNETFTVIFHITIAVITAIAGGLVALYSGENIGYTISKVEKKRTQLIKKHADNYQEWREKAVRSYRTSNHALGSKKAEAFRERIKEALDEESEEDLFDKEFMTPQDIDSELMIAYNSVTEFVKRNGRLPKPDELYSMGNNKEHLKRAYSQFLISNEKYLLEIGIVGRDAVLKARKYMATID